MESINMENKVVRAIFTDCLTLIENFSSQPNCEFKTFCKEYKNIKFQHIYTVQLNEPDMILTTGYLFGYCKSMFDIYKSTTNKEKIGAIYLMYCTYHKQPQKHYVKIRVNLETYKTIKNFVDSYDKNLFSEQAQYIFYHLLSVNAFRFVFSEISYGLEKPNKSNDYKFFADELNNRNENFLNSEISTLTDEKTGFFKAFSLLETEYNAKKIKLNQKEPIESNKIPLSNIIKEYKNKISEIENILQIEKIPEKEFFPCKTKRATEKSIKEECWKMSEQRVKIKNKAFKEVSTDRKVSVLDKSSNSISDCNDDSERERESSKEVELYRNTKSRKLVMNELLNQSLPKSLLKELGGE